jgi:hypothetical protein
MSSASVWDAGCLEECLDFPFVPTCDGFGGVEVVLGFCALVSAFGGVGGGLLCVADGAFGGVGGGLPCVADGAFGGVGGGLLCVADGAVGGVGGVSDSSPSCGVSAGAEGVPDSACAPARGSVSFCFPLSRPFPQGSGPPGKVPDQNAFHRFASLLFC